MAAAVAGLLIVTGCTADKPKPQSPPSRILQSVAVQMTPDGTMTAVDGTAVSVRDSAADATTENTTYSPRAVADDLPVRVSAAYRTADRTGTNLSDLAGYTGRIEIDLTVQNLTVRPQNLTYDVAGSSRTQSALVGSPLTVVASTVLPKTEPTDVITASAPGASAATNGVLSQSEDGAAVVQWAALLASPQTGANATLRLVTDAKSFTVPTFDLSVQPGLVTDPSVSGVLESAFNSNPTSQLALERRTIKVITEVNDVLTRASSNISTVRKNLDSTSSTLGTRTVEELRTSTKGVSSSMKGLDQELKSLRSDISSSLDATQSSVLQELSQTVSTMDQLLGDTTATPPSPVVDGKGCKTVVQGPKDGGSVYGNLMQVTAQLDGYATATEQCKKQAQQALLHSVGPKEPTAATCQDPSTTCALYSTEQKFGSIMEDLVAKGQDVVDSLQPGIVTGAGDEFQKMSDAVDAIQKATKDLSDFNPHEDLDSRLTKVDDRLDVVDERVDALSTEVDSIHDDAVLAQDKIDKTVGGEPSMIDQNAQLAYEICRLRQDPLFGHGLTDDEIRTLRSYLVDQSCQWDVDDDGNVIDLQQYRDKTGYPHSMKTRLQDQADAWQQIIDLTDVHDDSQGVGERLANLRAQIDLTRSRVASVQAAVDTGEKGFAERMKPLQDSVKTLVDNRDAFEGSLSDLEAQQKALGAKITAAFSDAADTANDEVSETIDSQIRKVAAQATVDSRAVTDMFAASSAGLSSAADQISDNGTRTISKQKAALEESAKKSAAAATKQVNQSLARMAGGVSSSTRDMNSASAQLTASLNKVLLDLGTRKVNGSGLLGSMTTSAAKVGTADYQLALASSTTTSYANVRSEDVNGILLRQAQLQAALEAAAQLPAFHLDVPSGAQSQTIYTFRIGARQ